MLVYLGDIAGAGIMELLVCFTFQQHASVSKGHSRGRYHGERRSVCVSTDRDAPVTVHPIPFAWM